MSKGNNRATTVTTQYWQGFQRLLALQKARKPEAKRRLHSVHPLTSARFVKVYTRWSVDLSANPIVSSSF